MFLFRLDGAQVGSITRNAATAGVLYNQTSDKRLKTLVGPVDDLEALNLLGQIEPVEFTWNDYPEAGVQTGFFAQDVAEHIPSCVAPGTGEPGDEDFIPWGMDNSALVPHLVAAVRALMRRTAALEAAT